MPATLPLTGNAAPPLTSILAAGDVAAAAAGRKGAPGEWPNGETLGDGLLAPPPPGSVGDSIATSASANEEGDSMTTLVSAFKKAMTSDPASGQNNPLLVVVPHPQVRPFEFEAPADAAIPAPGALPLSRGPVASTGPLIPPGSSGTPIALQPPGDRRQNASAILPSSDTPVGFAPILGAAQLPSPLEISRSANESPGPLIPPGSSGTPIALQPPGDRRQDASAFPPSSDTPVGFAEILGATKLQSPLTGPLIHLGSSNGLSSQDSSAHAGNSDTPAGFTEKNLPFERSSANPPGTESETLGAAMLQSLLYQSTSATQPAALVANAEVARSTRIATLEKIIADTVSRVLVSDPLHDGNREIRLEIAREVLPDTSVRLWREAGRLHVEFVSSASVAASALSASLPQLVTAIQQLDPRLEPPVVSLRGDAETGQPGDGRSRQRYYQPDETTDLA